MFWIACKQYSKLTDRYQMIRLAKDIYDLHLRPGAPEAVNINSKTRQYVLSNLSNPPSDLFHQAEREVFTLMKFDCYQRFLKSDLFVECLTAEKLGKPLPCNNVEGSKSPSGTRFRSKSRDRHRIHPKKANSTNYGSSNNKLNAISDDGNSTTRRSFLSCKKDINTVWNRLQQRMDDQRGTELQCDIPEFLRCPQESSSVI
ncbi:regulator of G-protein signaling 18-like [Uloborus diversus]|uniref:regulator of G-protein signaling 18-like n=1 Tax=Uloborus diversus TaxID=327109 RepID=UPI002409D47D|nr:regulator of G-protein signaling 18-like [Uloborus diversus]